MKAPTLTYEQLKKASQTYNELTYQGFLLNVFQSYKEGVITKEEKDDLIINYDNHMTQIEEILERFREKFNSLNDTHSFDRCSSECITDINDIESFLTSELTKLIEKQKKEIEKNLPVIEVFESNKDKNFAVRIHVGDEHYQSMFIDNYMSVGGSLGVFVKVIQSANNSYKRVLDQVLSLKSLQK